MRRTGPVSEVARLAYFMLTVCKQATSLTEVEIFSGKTGNGKLETLH